jgi:hypothetical protein
MKECKDNLEKSSSRIIFDRLFHKIQLLPDLVREPVAEQGLIGYRFNRSQFSNGMDLEGIHFYGHILKLPFTFFLKDIAKQLIVY